MNREQLMKMSKKELKARLVTVGKEAQDKSGEELTALMDEARTIGEILDEIKGREELVKSWTRLKPVRNLQRQPRQQPERAKDRTETPERVQRSKTRQEQRAVRH